MCDTNHCTSQTIEPEGLSNLLKEFTFCVLRDKPTDLIDYGIEFMTRKKQEQRKKTPMYIICTPEEAKEPEHLTPISERSDSFKMRQARRKSVAAEPLNPDTMESFEKILIPKTSEQRERIKKVVDKIILFRSLDNEQLEEILDAMYEREVTKDEEVITQGNDGDDFYVIEKGVFDVFIKTNGPEQLVFTYDNSGSFGELALMYNQPRAATVRARTPGLLWAMDRDSFRRIVLVAAARKRRMYDVFLRSVPMLSALDEYERMSLADGLITKKFSKDECIIQEQDTADGMYFLEKGNVKVTMTTNGTETEISVLEKGNYFGEVALIENTPRTANVYAVDNVRVAFLQRDSFERLLGPCMEVMKRQTIKYRR